MSAVVMRAALILVAAALAAAPMTPALADGFSAADLTAAATQSANPYDANRSDLAAYSEQLRLAFAADPQAALAAATPEEAARLRAALSIGAPGSDPMGDLRARWFMAGAIVSAYPNARMTAFYNPLARGWLLINWAAQDGHMAVAGARLAAAGPSDWTSQSGPYLAALVADYRATEGIPGDSPGAAAGAEADRWITGVAMQMRDPAQRAALDTARRTIAGGHAAQFGGGVVDLMPARARASFGPVAGFNRAEGGRSALFGSALYPKILIAADFDAGARLARLTLINLGAAQ